MRAGDEQGLVPRALVFVMLELILKSFAEQQGRCNGREGEEIGTKKEAG
jgi:hypothetical protein